MLALHDPSKEETKLEIEQSVRTFVSESEGLKGMVLLFHRLHMFLKKTEKRNRGQMSKTKAILTHMYVKRKEIKVNGKKADISAGSLPLSCHAIAH